MLHVRFQIVKIYIAEVTFCLPIRPWSTAFIVNRRFGPTIGGYLQCKNHQAIGTVFANSLQYSGTDQAHLSKLYTPARCKLFTLKMASDCGTEGSITMKAVDQGLIARNEVILTMLTPAVKVLGIH